MPLDAGRRLGPYEIEAPAGAGGMGEVYRAKDTRLDRTVAVKVLPSSLAGDEDLRKRFEQEARAVSSLSHPNICPLYDVGREDGVDFMVMEYLEGETLADRLKRGALALDEALGLARRMADALDKAHHRGVVHRDLKPANVMLTKDGPKLLDFGLAKLHSEAIDPALSAVATQDKPLTREGSIVGTLHYMAPEQLEGKDVDSRADLFSLGAVLYEMVTGRKAFSGESPASIITAIMSTAPPPMTELAPIAPPSLERLVAACLQKDRDARWQSAGDLSREFSWIAGEKSASVETAAASRSSRTGWVVAGALGLFATVLLVSLLLRPRESRELVHLNLSPPEGTRLHWSFGTSPPMLSPDGRQIAFSVLQENKFWLAVRSLDSPEARLITEVDPIPVLAWSLDGGAIVYRGMGSVMRVELATQTARTLASIQGTGLAQNAMGTLLAGQTGGPIFRFDDGTTEATRLEEGESGHSRPYFLPDGDRFLFFVPSSREIHLARLGSTESRFVRSADSGAQYVEPGYLLFVEGGTLVAQRFDVSSGEVQGRPVPLAQPMSVSPFGLASFSATSDVLAYASGVAELQLQWMDRRGNSLGRIGEPGDYRQMTLSPDGRRAIVSRGTALWVLDLEREGVASRLTQEGLFASDHAWSEEGNEVVMTGSLSGRSGLYRQSLAAGAEPELVLASEGSAFVDQWLGADNRATFHAGAGGTIALLSMDGSGEVEEIVRQQASVDEPHRSPDGKWLAFISLETGRHEIHVENLETRVRVRISSEGGGQPRWRRDGRELFFLGLDGSVMAVDFDPSDGPQGIARPLFRAPLGAVMPNSDQWDVHPDGDRFLMLTPAGPDAPYHVVLNWRRLLEDASSQ